MILFLKLSNTLIFMILALWHFYWASGGKVGTMLAIPQISADNLQPLFVPRKQITALIACLLMGMAVVQWLPYFFSYWCHAILFLIFSLRAIGDFKYVGLFKKIQGTIFSRADNRYFIPLCIWLAVSHCYLLIFSAY